jgi:hypothetical protein
MRYHVITYHNDTVLKSVYATYEDAHLHALEKVRECISMVSRMDEDLKPSYVNLSTLRKKAERGIPLDDV